MPGGAESADTKDVDVYNLCQLAPLPLEPCRLVIRQQPKHEGRRDCLYFVLFVSLSPVLDRRA
jgi:hypothetical protein